MDLLKLRGRKGCENCPSMLVGLALALEETAKNRHAMGEKDWERAHERATGVRLAIGLLTRGVDKEGQIYADLPCPPNVPFEEWKGGPRFIRGVGFQDRPEDMMTNPDGKAPATIIPPGPKRKSKKRKQGTGRKGMQVLSLDDLKKRRET